MGVLIQYFDLQPFIVTLAGMFLARGPLLPDQHRFDQHHRSDCTRPSSQCRIPVWGGASISVGAVIAIVVSASAASTSPHYTPFGPQRLRVGGNEQSALLMGLPVRGTRSASTR